MSDFPTYDPEQPVPGEGVYLTVAGGSDGPVNIAFTLADLAKVDHYRNVAADPANTGRDRMELMKITPAGLDSLRRLAALGELLDDEDDSGDELTAQH